MLKKIKDTIVYIFAGIGAILGAIFLLNINKSKGVKIDREEAANNREVEILKKQLESMKADRAHLEAEVVTLKETLDGRSKKVREAKKAVKTVDIQISDLEEQLGIK